MKLNKNKIIYQDKTPEYRKVISEAQEKHPEDFLKQMEYVKKNGTPQHYALWLSDRLHYVSSLHSFKELKLDSINTELLGSSLLDALSHMQQDLPDGVYNYIICNMEFTIKEVINQMMKQP